MNSDRLEDRTFASPQYSQTVNLLERINRFLAGKLKAEPGYSELTNTISSLRKRIEPTAKPTVKIVSPSKVLAFELQRQNEENEAMRSLYQFAVVSPISQIQSILHHCDLICLLYDSSQKIVAHHQKLIEQALAAKIPLFLLVNRGKSDFESYTAWLHAQEYSGKNLFNNVILPLEDFIELNNRQQIEFYQQRLINFSPVVRDSLPERIKQAASQEVELFFRQQLASNWQEINQIKDRYFAGKTVHIYQQQLREKISSNNQFRQQLDREIKQALNHAKANFINPFSANSLILEIQQIISSTRVKVIKKPKQVYLYLVLEDSPDTLLLDYVWDLCQRQAASILKQEWEKVTRVYGSGGLEALRARTNEDLSSIGSLLDDRELAPAISSEPSLDLATVIDYYALEFNSRIIFDYNYLQSSWFRLLISIAIGMAIYFFTLLFFGAGRYFGFLIIIFQIINLITGQSIKKNRLKQQTKELKRMSEQRYQSLVRIAIDRLAQTSISATDSQIRQDRELWCESIAIAQQKIAELKQTSDRHKSRIDSLNQTRSTIQSLVRLKDIVCCFPTRQSFH